MKEVLASKARNLRLAISSPTMNFSKEQAANFATRHRFGIAYAIMVLSSLFLLSAFNGWMQGDVSHYKGIADSMFNGKLPYRDFMVEYPPYSLPFFVLPRIFGQANYLVCFLGFAFLADWLIKLLLFAIGFRCWQTARALLPLLLYSTAIPFLRFILLQRYDLFPALICLVAVRLFCSRHYFLCGLAVAIGIGVKLYPAIFVPPLFILAARQAKGRRFVAGLAVGLLPIALLSFFLPWWHFAEFQGQRGLQVECLYASVLWLGKLLGLNQLQWVYVKMWYEVRGAAASALLPWARVGFVSAVMASTLVVIWATSRLSLSAEGTGPNWRAVSVSRLSRLMLVPLLAFVGFNQVLSPQYMIWLMPLAALTSLEGNLTPAFLIAVATMLTPMIYPSLFGDYGSGLGLFETGILVTRNLILIIAWVLLILDLKREIPQDMRWQAKAGLRQILAPKLQD